jgi:hypothetical protein
VANPVRRRRALSTAARVVASLVPIGIFWNFAAVVYIDGGDDTCGSTLNPTWPLAKPCAAAWYRHAAMSAILLLFVIVVVVGAWRWFPRTQRSTSN